MGNLVFQATLGGQVSLVGPNTASTFTLNVPAVSSTLATLAANTFTGTQTLSTLTSPAATNLLIQSAATTAITIDTSQNVGVGVTPSAWGLGKAIEMTQSGNSLWAVGSGNDIRLTANAYYNGTNYKYGATNYANMYIVGSGSGQHQWYTAPSGTAGTNITFTQAMTLDASGKLVIGDTTATGVLTVSYDGEGLLRLNRKTTTTGAAFIQFSNGGGNYYIGPDSSTGNRGFATGGAAYGLVINAESAYPIVFGTTNTERARIDSSGNLLVGTTSSSTTTGGIVVNPGNGQNSTISISHASGASSGNFYVGFGYGASNIGSITQNGTTGVLYNLTSDYRLKNNQQALTGAKDFIMALKPKKWQWWDGSGEGVGFIAHEFMEVAKYSGHGEKDAVDEEGNPVYQSIQPSSSEVMANLVSLIQEQQVLITQLQADVAALKG